MLLQQRQVAAAVARRVFQLPADFANRLALPSHFQRRKAPTGMTGNAFIASGFMQRHIVLGVAFGAVGAEVTCFAAPNRRPVFVIVRTLQRMIASRVAVHAARMRQHLADFSEYRPGSLGLV
jgi:hypothetical protein